jgi:transposase-like protein
MAKSEEKLQALKLRRAGESIKEIAKKLGVSRSSASLWVRDIELTAEQREYLQTRQIASGHRGRMMGTEMNRNKRLQRIEDAKEYAKLDIPTLSKQDLFFVGLGLYWGEGVKSNSGSLAISNSDPRVIALIMHWFSSCFGVERDRFMPRIFISDTHRDREEDIINFWIQRLGIPRTQFKKTVFLDKGKKLYENRYVYYGVMALGVAKGGDIRHRILAGIDRTAFLDTEAKTV